MPQYYPSVWSQLGSGIQRGMLLGLQHQMEREDTAKRLAEQEAIANRKWKNDFTAKEGSEALRVLLEGNLGSEGERDTYQQQRRGENAAFTRVLEDRGPGKATQFRQGLGPMSQDRTPIGGETDTDVIGRVYGVPLAGSAKPEPFAGLKTLEEDARAVAEKTKQANITARDKSGLGAINAFLVSKGLEPISGGEDEPIPTSQILGKVLGATTQAEAQRKNIEAAGSRQDKGIEAAAGVAKTKREQTQADAARDAKALGAPAGVSAQTARSIAGWKVQDARAKAKGGPASEKEWQADDRARVQMFKDLKDVPAKPGYSWSGGFLGAKPGDSIDDQAQRLIEEAPPSDKASMSRAYHLWKNSKDYPDNTEPAVDDEPAAVPAPRRSSAPAAPQGGGSPLSGKQTDRADGWYGLGKNRVQVINGVIQ